MNLQEIRKAKAEVRRQVSHVLAGLPLGRRRDTGIAVARRLATLPPVLRARTIMAFLSLPTEVDTWPAIQWAWREGKRIVIPRIEAGPEGCDAPLSASPCVAGFAEQGRQRRMVAVALDLPAGRHGAADIPAAADHPAVRPGALGILEVPDAAPVPVAEIDVVLVPCQAVDRRGNRLGKGGGFYDRFLADPDLRAETIALAFHEQLLDEVPVAEGDRRVRRLVTDEEILVFDVGSGRESLEKGVEFV
ncbi:MAG TPA: 5-formyltetrahydrofolate cyclo-ligase [Phycisphaerae bacterium]|nr:5-formyltetrahydrofolate cyclo-ligase [Phycisphaerae bacterium]